MGVDGEKENYVFFKVLIKKSFMCADGRSNDFSTYGLIILWYNNIAIPALFSGGVLKGLFYVVVFFPVYM